MNYQMLKTLVDSLIQNFRCPNCGGVVKENNLEIVGAAGTSLNFDVLCPHCEKHTFVKAEVSQINLGNMVDISPENLDELKQKLHQKLSNINFSSKEIGNLPDADMQINDEEILELRDTLNHEHLNVHDLFDEK